MASIAQINLFISTFVPIVRKKCEEHGWGVVSAIVAQAGLESAWGTSSLGGLTRSDSCYNFWGMKWVDGCGCDYKAFSTKEQNKDGSYITIVSKFRKYKNVEDGIDGYFKFIESYKRYKPVMAVKSGDYNGYATQIKNCGWATSLQYTQNIINTIKKYSLSIYDNPNVQVGSASRYQKGTTYTTTANLFVRIEPKGDKKRYSELSANAKIHAYDDGLGFGILKKGTKVTCKDLREVGNQTWIQIPSGWICAINGDKIYIE